MVWDFVGNSMIKWADALRTRVNVLMCGPMSEGSFIFRIPISVLNNVARKPIVDMSSVTVK